MISSWRAGTNFLPERRRRHEQHQRDDRNAGHAQITANPMGSLQAE
jgi:hypothetical protein